MLGLGLGLHRGIFKSAVSYVSSLIKAFKVRVALASGIFEAQSCLNTTLSNLNTKGLLTKASLFITPNAYKASKLYSVIPNTTLGDLNVVRNTTATRINSLGLVESVLANVSRLDYTNGICPTILVEPQRKNNYLYSNQFDLWGGVINANITSNYSISPDGTQNAYRYISIAAGYIYNFSSQSTGINTVSVWAKRNDSGVGKFGFFIEGNPLIVSEFALTNQWKRFEYTFNLTNNHVGLAAEIGVDVSIYGMQIELGNYKTSYIPTVASTVTRNYDVISNSNINNFVGINQGTFAYYLKGYTQQSAIGQPYWCYLKDGVKELFFYDNVIFTTINGTFQSIYSLPNGLTPFKVACRWNASFISIFINGIKVAEVAKTNTFNPTTFSLSGNPIISKQEYNSIYASNSDLTDTECINLTTL